MKAGATSIELDFTYSFTDDGDADLQSVCLGSRRLPEKLAARLLDWMGAKVQEHLVNEAWENADEETDDASCDEARSA